MGEEKSKGHCWVVMIYLLNIVTAFIRFHGDAFSNCLDISRQKWTNWLKSTVILKCHWNDWKQRTVHVPFTINFVCNAGMTIITLRAMHKKSGRQKKIISMYLHLQSGFRNVHIDVQCFSRTHKNKNTMIVSDIWVLRNPLTSEGTPAIPRALIQTRLN